jgi:hypothetical protein
LHYFDVYDRHLARFALQKATLAEVGIYSGGSLPMWHHYLGDQLHVHGIDIMPTCSVYAGPTTTIHIGDQADRSFWRKFRHQVPTLDILIDDGGHHPDQQIVTLEEVLPHLSANGVYICEDIHGIDNSFAGYVHAMADRLNAFDSAAQSGLGSAASPFQKRVASVHFYPHIVVIEMGTKLADGLSAPKHGTQWQPFTMESAAYLARETQAARQ